jgi:lipopolysaccharide transport system permease protein
MKKFWSYRHLILSFANRQFQIRYRQSLIGFVWAIVPPLVTVFAATLVFHKVARVDTGDIPYPLFAFSALAPWTFFANGLAFGVPSVVVSQQMVSRVPFPRIALPVSAVVTLLVDLAIASGTFVVFAYVTGAGLPITAIWYPALVTIEIALVLGLVLLGSALDVCIRDIRLAVPFLAQIWLLLTPVMYPLSSVPADLRPLYLLNPMTGLVVSFRNVLVEGRPPAGDLLITSVIGALVALVLGTWYFLSTERRFADVI